VIWLLVVFLGIVGLRTCSTTTPQAPPEILPRQSLKEVATPIAVEPMAEVAPSDMERAARHAGLAVGAEGTSGAMIYSVNCYAAVKRRYSQGKLDQCGAFDLLAARMTSDPVEFPVEAEYFQPEAGAGRYTDNAAAAGASPEIMAERFAKLKALSDDLVLVPVTPPPAVVDIDATDAMPEASDHIGDVDAAENISTGDEDLGDGL
jgi:hypothetical protein